jgi:hypothetical protein
MECGIAKMKLNRQELNKERRWHMSNLPKTVFVVSVDPKNYDAAALTIAALRIVLENRDDLCLAVDTEKGREELPKIFFQEIKEDWREVFVADFHFKDKVYKELRNSKLPVPFFPGGWGYNDPMNCALPIARIAGRNYVMRLDAGTLPYLDFEALVEEHTDMLARGQRAVVSTTYAKRIALRCDLVPVELRPTYCNFVKEFTGIDPLNQLLVAGAGLTQSVPGHPGVALQNRLVWAIDDADFSTRLGALAALSTRGRIYRSAPGFPLDANRYAGRLASMVVVKELRGGADQAKAGKRAEEFLKGLKTYFQVEASGVLTHEDLKKVTQGLADFDDLCSRWNQVVDAICEIETTLPKGCKCRI